MESNRKRRSFIKGKLISFNRSSANNKPSTTVQYNSKVKPSHSSPSQASVGYLVHHQDYVFSAAAQPKQKVSFIVSDHNNNNRGKLSIFDHAFGGLPADESVDLKAASYISTVQERFKLEGINRDMHGAVVEMRN